LPSKEDIRNAILTVAKDKPHLSVFKASEVRDYLGLPKNQARNEPIREFCRTNRKWLNQNMLLLLEERDPELKRPKWFILKQ
jgi:hypothetical protein